MMEMEVKDDGTNRVQDYKARVRKLQDAAHASFTARRSATTPYQKKPWVNYTDHIPKSTSTAAPSDKGKEKDKEKGTATKKEAKKYPRSRKCKNFPSCGDGEHWDAECKLRNSNLPSKQTRAYYADAHAISDAYEERDEDSDAEEYYGNVMQAHFAYQYQKNLDEEEGFTGMDGSPEPIASIALPLAQPKPDTPFHCGNCGEGFKLKRLLYKHLKAMNHYTKTTKEETPQAPVVVTSNAIHAEDPEDRIQDCQFMTLNVTFTPDRSETYEIVADTGIANSAIDAGFLREKAPNAVIHTLTNPRIIRGIGGSAKNVTQLATIPTYLIAEGNRLAKLTITYHIFTNLACNILIGNDVFLSESAEIKFAQNHMSLGSCDSLKVPIKVTIKEKASKIIVRIAAKAVIPPRSMFLLPVKLSKTLEPGQHYLFLSKQKAITSQACSAGIFKNDQKSVMLLRADSGDTKNRFGSSRLENSRNWVRITWVKTLQKRNSGISEMAQLSMIC
ncbi:hypothetical protein DFP73DRAFT_598805 [Morchella snyderi]|nr:hypothetical protein DFP73DRAFT_598805 [Morchella snyderi]